MFQKSLRFQITLFVSLAMIIASGVALWSVDRLMNAQRRRVAEDLRNDAETGALQIARAVGEHSRAVVDAGLYKYINASTLNLIVKNHSYYNLVVVTDQMGRVSAVNGKDFEGQTLKTADWNGAKSVADTEWFQKTSRLSVNQVYIENFAKDPLVSQAYGQEMTGNGFSAPIFDNEKFVGVVSLRASERWLSSALAEYFKGLQENGIYNPRLRVLNREGKDLLKLGPESGNERLALGAHPVQGEMGWVVQIAFPHAQLYSEIEGTRGFFYIMEVLLALIGMGAAYLFGGRLLRTMTMVSGRLDHQCTGVNQVAQKLEASSAQLSNSVTEQAAALQRTVASIDQVSTMISKNADNASQSQTVSRTNMATAERGQKVVEEMIGSIEEINRSNAAIMQQIEAGNQEISNIVKVITEIGEKTKVINDIVFQTKLLSFNASVEAARAGEHGKGFSVVAEEVGNLAQMSGNAAKEISDMLTGSIQKVEGIVSHTGQRVASLVSQGRDKVEAGTVTARRCGETLVEIVKNVGLVDQLVAEIATASKEQAIGASEITKAMNQLDQIIQENATMAKNSASVATDLRGKADEVQGALGTLKATVFGPVAINHSVAVKPLAPISPKKNNVLPLNRKPQTQTETVKKAKAAHVGVPSANDHRFEEI